MNPSEHHEADAYQNSILGRLKHSFPWLRQFPPKMADEPAVVHDYSQLVKNNSLSVEDVINSITVRLEDYDPIFSPQINAAVKGLGEAEGRDAHAALNFLRAFEDRMLEGSVWDGKVIEDTRQKLRQKLGIKNEAFQGMENYLSELKLTDESISLILSVFNGELKKGAFEEQIILAAQRTAHPVLKVNNRDGLQYICKIHHDEAGAKTEQAGSYYLPQSGLYFIVPTHIIRPFSNSGVYLTLQQYVPENKQIKQNLEYYLEAIAKLHAHGKRALQNSGVYAPVMRIPEFDEILENIRFNRQTEKFTSISKIQERRSLYEEGRHMFAELDNKENGISLIHSDLFLKQLIGPYIGDLESLRFGNDAFTLATWLNDPDRPLSDEQKVGELSRYHMLYTLENPLNAGSFSDLHRRVIAATSIRELMSFAWNSAHPEDLNSAKKREFIGAKFYH